MSAPLVAGRRFRKVAIKVLRPELVFPGVPLDVMTGTHAPLPVPIVRDLLLQICAALQHAHDHGVIHGDVRPANILIDDRGDVRVNDFGGAGAVESRNWTRVQMTSTATGTAKAADGAEYVSPEQCLGQPASFASDQYSVGLIAYELLTGLPPFIGHPVEVQWAHLREAPVWVGFPRRDCPTPLAAVVMRMLAKEPNERWPSLRSAASLIAMAPAMGPTNRRAALARLVRDLRSAQPPITRPRPVTSLEFPPRPRALAGDPGQTPSPSPSLPRTGQPGARPWPRRLAMAAGLAAAFLAIAWFEALTLASRPNDPSVSKARATARAVPPTRTEEGGPNLPRGTPVTPK